MDPMTMMSIAQAGSSLIKWLSDSGGQQDTIKKLPTKNKAQLGLLDQVLGDLTKGGGYRNAMGLLTGLLDPNSEIYKSFSDPYMQQFEQQTVPMLAERFAGFGGGMGGGLSSSAFGQALGAAGGNLQSQLAQMMAGLRTNAAQGVLGQAQNAMGVDPFAYVSRQGSPGMLQSMMPGIGQGVANAGMNYFMNNSGGGGGMGGGQGGTQMLDQLFRSGQLSYT